MAYLITPQQLAAIAGRETPLMASLALWMNRICPEYEIDTAKEYCHFLAQACHETDHFRTLREYASGKAYEGRLDLGNTKPGDGVRFKGRGIFQTTGRANYLQLGIRKGRRDLFINNPELLEQAEYAVWSACEFWQTRSLNDVANHADGDILKKKLRGKVIEVSPVEYISITVNGGDRGMAQRKKYYAIAQQVLAEASAAPAVRELAELAGPSLRDDEPVHGAAKAARKSDKKAARKAAEKGDKKAARKAAKKAAKKSAKKAAGQLSAKSPA